MTRYSTGDVSRALAEAGVERGDMVCVHSSLLALGRPSGFGIRDAPAVLAQALMDAIGSSGTLVVPAFNFGFCRGEPFDYQTTPSVNVGVLSEHVRQLPQARRSRHPMHSLATVGPLAGDICERDTVGSLDAGGSFDALLEHDALLLFIGTSSDAATVLHVAEQRADVPYRYRKEFTGQVTDHGKSREATYALHVRDLDLDPRLELASVGEALRARGLERVAPLGAGAVRAGRCRDYVAETAARLADDPWAFVVSTAETRP